MDKSFLHKYTGIEQPGDGAAEVLDLEVDDHGAFSWLRGIRDRAVMLELRKKSGNCLAISYGFIDRVEFDPSKGIVISVSGKTITIRGRNLNGAVGTSLKLFEGIIRHRVPWVREASQAELMEAKEGRCVVEVMEW